MRHERMRNRAVDSVEKQSSERCEVVIEDLPRSMAHSPPVADLDLENAPFSAEQRKWLEQFTQWARPPPPTTNEQSAN